MLGKAVGNKSRKKKHAKKHLHCNKRYKSHYYDKEMIVDFKTSPDNVSLDKIIFDINGF
jgi:hypothetical protein